MITDKMQYLAEDLNGLRSRGLFRPLRVLESAQDTEVTIEGRRLLNLSSNNYLGLTTHPRLTQAMIEATAQYGAGSGAVRTIAGTMAVHEALERKLADFGVSVKVLAAYPGPVITRFEIEPAVGVGHEPAVGAGIGRPHAGHDDGGRILAPLCQQAIQGLAAQQRRISEQHERLVNLASRDKSAAKRVEGHPHSVAGAERRVLKSAFGGGDGPCDVIHLRPDNDDGRRGCQRLQCVQ